MPPHTLRDAPDIHSDGFSPGRDSTSQYDDRTIRPVLPLCEFHVVTTTIIIINCVIFFIQFISGEDWTNTMANVPYYSAYKWEIYRYFTHSFQHLGLLHLLFNMLTLILFGNTLEFHFGSACMLALSLFFSVVIGVIYTYTHVLLASITNDTSWLYQGVAGYSGNLFAFIWLFFVVTHIQTLSCCGFQLPARAYPFVLLIITSLGNNPVSFLGHLSGLFTGVLYHFGFFNYCTFPRAWLVFWERDTIVGRFITQIIPKFVLTPLTLTPYLEAEQFSIFRRVWPMPTPPTLLCFVFGMDTHQYPNVNVFSWCCRRQRRSTAHGHTLGGGDSLPSTTAASTSGRNAGENNALRGNNHPLIARLRGISNPATTADSVNSHLPADDTIIDMHPTAGSIQNLPSGHPSETVPVQDDVGLGTKVHSFFRQVFYPSSSQYEKLDDGQHDSEKQDTADDLQLFSPGATSDFPSGGFLPSSASAQSASLSPIPPFQQSLTVSQQRRLDSGQQQQQTPNKLKNKNIPNSASSPVRLPKEAEFYTDSAAGIFRQGRTIFPQDNQSQQPQQPQQLSRHPSGASTSQVHAPRLSSGHVALHSSSQSGRANNTNNNSTNSKGLKYETDVESAAVVPNNHQSFNLSEHHPHRTRGTGPASTGGGSYQPSATAAGAASGTDESDEPFSDAVSNILNQDDRASAQPQLTTPRKNPSAGHHNPQITSLLTHHQHSSHHHVDDMGAADQSSSDHPSSTR